MPDAKTIRYLKKTLSELSNRYQEYKESVSPLKQVITELGDTITNNKLEIFPLKKKGYNGPYEDEEMFRICHAMQTKLLETRAKTNFKDFDKFEKLIEDKLWTMDTELQHLQRMSRAFSQQPDPIGNMSEMVKKKQLEIRALKQEQDQLLKQTEDNRTEITTLKHKLKQRKKKICCLKQAILEQRHKTQVEFKDLDAKYEQDKCESKKATETMQKTIEELQDQLKQNAQEQKTLENNFEKEKCSHQTTKESLNQAIKALKGQLIQTVIFKKDLENTKQELEQTNKERDRLDSENQAMVESGKELQVQLQNVMKENKALEENYQQEKIENKNKRQQLDHTMKELERVNSENCTLEEIYQQENRTLVTVREELDNTRRELDHIHSENHIMAKKQEELQVLFQNTVKENSSLLENYKQEKMKHKNAREELDQTLKKLSCVNSENQVMAKKEEELQVQLQNIMKENKALEENYQQEKMKYKCINESRNHIIKELDHVNDENQAMAKKEKELQVQLRNKAKENSLYRRTTIRKRLKTRTKDNSWITP
ncbi:trichohyalin-like [Takifugu flavidus]|uniref:trichohyalin-like n=1 Tax=Takifugu flavidus TaxID=433684 RepID=UPI002544023D|nr:trichohyalin-like [Takifugu flavidus]